MECCAADSGGGVPSAQAKQHCRGLVPDLAVELVQDQLAIQVSEGGTALFPGQSRSGVTRRQERLAEPGRQRGRLWVFVSEKQKLSDGVIDRLLVALAGASQCLRQGSLGWGRRSGGG